MDELHKIVQDPKTKPEELRQLALLHPELTEVVAQNPSAPPEFLEELAKKKIPGLGLFLVQNPNTPPQTLFTLGYEYPEQLLQNPAFSLLFLENPQLVQSLPEQLLGKLAALPNVPGVLLQRAANSYVHVTRAGVAQNPNAPADALLRLAGDELVMVRGHALKNPSLPERARALFARLGVTENQPTTPDPSLTEEELLYLSSSGIWARVLIASHPNTSPEILAYISQTHSQFNPYNQYNTTLFAAIAKNPKTPPETLLQLSARYETQIKEALLTNPNTPAKVILELAKQPSLTRSLQLLIASRPELPIEVLAAYAKKPRPGIRAAIAQNKSTPEEILRTLSEDEAFHIREKVASRTDISGALLSLLAKDSHASVRATIAQNPKTPLEILERLVEDSKPQVRTALARRKDLPARLLEKLAQDEKPGVHSIALQNPSTPKELVSLLTRIQAKTPITEEEAARVAAMGPYPQRLLATHPSAPASLLAEMARSPLRSARYAVSLSPSIDLQLLIALTEDSDAQIRATAAQNLAARLSPLEQLEELVLNFATQPASLPSWLQQRLQKALARYQRMREASNPNTPPDQLEQLANAQERAVKTKLATHPNLPLDALAWSGGRFAQRLLKNPSLQKQLAQNPEALQSLPPQSIAKIISQPETPEALLFWGAEHPVFEVRCAVAQNPKTPGTLLQKLAASSDPSFSLRRLLAQHPNAPTALLESLSKERDEWVKLWAKRALSGALGAP